VTRLRPEERCFICDRTTGKAGPGDGSIYWAQSGPWCQECSDTLRGEIEADSGRIAELEGERSVCPECRHVRLFANLSTPCPHCVIAELKAENSLLRDAIGKKRLGEHMHGIDVCAYCAAGDLAVAAKKELERELATLTEEHTEVERANERAVQRNMRLDEKVSELERQLEEARKDAARLRCILIEVDRSIHMCRIWGGMGWKYHACPPYRTERIAAKCREGLDSKDAAMKEAKDGE
jgi:uncharacterized protein (DUF983 family)